MDYNKCIRQCQTIVLAGGLLSCFTLHHPWQKSILLRLPRILHPPHCTILGLLKMLQKVSQVQQQYLRSSVRSLGDWLKSRQSENGLKRSKTPHQSPVSTQVTIYRNRCCQRRKRYREEKLLDKKRIFFLDLKDISIPQEISSHSHPISKSFQLRKCRCHCKTLLFWTILPATATFRKHTLSNLFQWTKLRRFLMHIFNLKFIVRKRSDDQTLITTEGLFYENCILHNLFRHISVHKWNIVSTSNNLSNYASDKKFMLMNQKRYKKLTGLVMGYDYRFNIDTGGELIWVVSN